MSQVSTRCPSKLWHIMHHFRLYIERALDWTWSCLDSRIRGSYWYVVQDMLILNDELRRFYQQTEDGIGGMP